MKGSPPGDAWALGFLAPQLSWSLSSRSISSHSISSRLSVHQLSCHQLSTLDSRSFSPPSLSPPSLFSLHSALSALGLSAHSPSSLSVTRSISSLSGSVHQQLHQLSVHQAACCRCSTLLPIAATAAPLPLPFAALLSSSRCPQRSSLHHHPHSSLLPSNAVGRNLAMRVDENIGP